MEWTKDWEINDGEDIWKHDEWENRVRDKEWDEKDKK